MKDALAKSVLEVLKDVQHELDQEEIAPLVSLALDRKVATAIQQLAQMLYVEKE